MLHTYTIFEVNEYTALSGRSTAYLALKLRKVTNVVSNV